jgi:hypothetical protein
MLFEFYLCNKFRHVANFVDDLSICGHRILSRVKSLGRVRRSRVRRHRSYLVTLRTYDSYDACCASRMGKREGRRWLLPARGAALVNGKAGGRPPRTIYCACDALSPRVAFGGLKMVRYLTVNPQ